MTNAVTVCSGNHNAVSSSNHHFVQRDFMFLILTYKFGTIWSTSLIVFAQSLGERTR